MTKFYTKSGWLTAHGMACGYIHQLSDRDITLSHVTGNIYQVVVTKNSSFIHGFDWSEWDHNSVAYNKCFEGITEARRVYRKISKQSALPMRYESAAGQYVHT